MLIEAGGFHSWVYGIVNVQSILRSISFKVVTSYVKSGVNVAFDSVTYSPACCDWTLFDM